MDDETGCTEKRRAVADARLAQVNDAEWARIFKELLAFAFKRSQNAALAQDLAQEAMMRVLDARWEPWDPEKQPDLLMFLQSIVNRNLSNERKTRKRHREIDMDAEELGNLEGSARTPEQIASARDLAERGVRALRSRLRDAGDAEGLEVMNQFEDGNVSAEEQSLAMRQEIEVTRNARRRVFQHAEHVKQELEGGASEKPPKPARPVVVRRPAAIRPKRRRTTEKPKQSDGEGEP